MAMGDKKRPARRKLGRNKNGERKRETGFIVDPIVILQIGGLHERML